jgi:cell division protease FtsH
MQKKSAVITGALILLLLATVAGVVYSRPGAAVREVNFTQLREMAEAGGALSVEISGEVVTVKGADGALVRSIVTNAVAQHDVAAAFERHNIAVAFETQQPGVIVTVLGYLLPAAALLLFALIGWRVYASMGGMEKDIGSTETTGGQPVTFQDVAGVDEARSELAETIDFLRDPEKFSRLGGRRRAAYSSQALRARARLCSRAQRRPRRRFLSFRSRVRAFKRSSQG